MSSDQSAQPQLLTVEEAAAFLRVSVATIYRWKAEGSIPYLKPRGKLLFRLDELMNIGRDEKTDPSSAAAATRGTRPAAPSQRVRKS